jgi:hypothetical protein
MAVPFFSRANVDGPVPATPATARLSAAPAGRRAARLKTWWKITAPFASCAAM